MCTAVVIVEVIVCVKFGQGMFPKAHPNGLFFYVHFDFFAEVIISWAVFAVATVVWSIIYFGWYKPAKDARKKKKTN